jgi:ribonucleoside-diphosphate reductase beta chain
MGGDIQDWATKITDNERALLTQIFRFFTQSDVEVGGNYIERLLPVFKPLELQMMMAAFANMETVHIDAYALILKTLGMPQTEFEAFRDYKEMSDKATYMHGFKMDTEADVAKTLAMFGAFTEGMSLFASFAMLLNFPRHNKMNGMGQIVTWSVRDESLHCEAMIKLYHEWNKETGAVTPTVKRSIRTIARTMLTLEEKFIDLAFSLGPVEGMTPEDVKNYVSLVTDWRLVQLKLKPICGYFDKQGKQIKDHPLPWLIEILNGVEYANFFEQRATDYSKAATTGLWEDVWEK